MFVLQQEECGVFNATILAHTQRQPILCILVAARPKRTRPDRFAFLPTKERVSHQVRRKPVVMGIFNAEDVPYPSLLSLSLSLSLSLTLSLSLSLSLFPPLPPLAPSPGPPPNFPLPVWETAGFLTVRRAARRLSGNWERTCWTIVKAKSKERVSSAAIATCSIVSHTGSRQGKQSALHYLSQAQAANSSDAMNVCVCVCVCVCALV
jgi:hypothetical protein